MVTTPEVRHIVRRGGSAGFRLALLVSIIHALILFVRIAFPWSGLEVLIYLASFLMFLLLAYQLRVHEVSLERLACGLPLRKLSSPLRWPFNHLFILVEAASQSLGRQALLEQRSEAYEDQLLQQVSKTAAQEERNRLARDLHDSIKQQIFSIVVSAAAVKARWENNLPSAWKIVDDIERTALEAQVEMQALLQQLRPIALENVGLVESLRMQCQALSYRTGAQVETELSELPSETLLPLGTQETIFRIVQEGFANIARHARASRVWLSLYCQHDTLFVEIGDNGQGFDLSHYDERPRKDGGMGLCNIRERVTALGGIVSIWSQVEQGTTLHLSISLTKSPRQARIETQEQINKELARTIQKAHRTLSAGRRAVELGAVFMVLLIQRSFSLVALLICIVAAFIIWLWAQQYRMQTSFDLSVKHAQSYYLRARSQLLLVGILFLAGLYSFFLPAEIIFLLKNMPILVIGGAGVVFISIVTLFVVSSRNMYRYQQALSLDERQRIVQRSQVRVIIDWIVWIGACIAGVFLLSNGEAYTYEEAIQPFLFGFTLVAWMIAILEKWWRTMRWRRQLLRDRAT